MPAAVRLAPVAVSAVLAVATAAAWWMDRRSYDARWWAAPDGRLSSDRMGVLVGRAGGRVLLVRGTFMESGWGRVSGPAGSPVVLLVGWSFVFGDNPPASEFDHAGITFVRGPVDADSARWLVAVPDWMLITACSAAPAACAIRFRSRRRRRSRAGRCPACGYDLRATPGRCPECGAVPPKAGGGSLC